MIFEEGKETGSFPRLSILSTYGVCSCVKHSIVHCRPISSLDVKVSLRDIHFLGVLLVWEMVVGVQNGVTFEDSVLSRVRGSGVNLLNPVTVSLSDFLYIWGRQDFCRDNGWSSSKISGLIKIDYPLSLKKREVSYLIEDKVNFLHLVKTNVRPVLLSGVSLIVLGSLVTKLLVRETVQNVSTNLDVVTGTSIYD